MELIKSVALKYLNEKKETYASLQEVYDRLTDIFEDEEIPDAISEKLNQLDEQLKELKQLIDEYEELLKYNGVDISQ